MIRLGNPLLPMVAKIHKTNKVRKNKSIKNTCFYITIKDFKEKKRRFKRNEDGGLTLESKRVRHRD